MKILKHKSIEFSEVFLSELEKDIRMDSEYFQGYYVKYAALVKSKTNLKINEFAFVTDGIHASIDFDEESNINLISAKAPKEFGFDLSGTGYISNKQHNQNQRTALQKHDVIISTVGTIGNCSLVTSEILPANSDRHVGIVRINQENKVSPHFLTAYLNTKYGKAATMRETAGNVQLNLYIRNIKQLTIPTPTVKLQDEIDKLILEAHRQKLFSEKQYQEAEQILITELGLEYWKPKTKKFKLFNVPFEIEINYSTGNELSNTIFSNRIDSEFYEPKYSEIFEKLKSYSGGCVKVFNHFSQRNEIIKKEKQEYNYIEIGDIDISTGKANYNLIEKVELPANAKQKVYKGDVLYSKVRPYRGAVSIIEEEIPDVIVSGAFTIISENKSSAYNKETLFILLRSSIYKTLIMKYNVGSSYPIVKDTNVLNLPLPLFDKKFQNTIKLKVNNAINTRQQSTILLATSKKAVEIFIEQDEKAALNYIKKRK